MDTVVKAEQMKDDFKNSSEEVQIFVIHLMDKKMKGGELEDDEIIFTLMAITAEMGKMKRDYEKLRASYTAMVRDL